MLENKKINLDLPVDAYDAQGNPKEKAMGISEDNSTEVSQTEEKKEVVLEKKDKENEDEQRVPYSRFNKVRERAEQAEEEAAEARRLLREVQSQQMISRETSSSSYEEDYARDLKRLYGDTPVSNEIIHLNLKHQRAMEERAEQRAIAAIERKQQNEVRALTQNENVIDARLGELAEKLGRDLTEKEESSLLEIVDEYTPTGTDGRYIGEIIPFDKAWEVHELRQNKATSKRSKNPALFASNTRSEGEASGEVEKANSNFNPLNWKSLYDRIGKN